MATDLPQDLRNQANGLGQYRPQTEAELILDATRGLVSGYGKISTRSNATVAGDSLEAYGLAYGVANSGGTLSNSRWLWANDKLAQYGQQIDIVSSVAVPGSTLDDLINTQLPLALADSSPILIVNSGVNTLNPNGSNLSIPAALAKAQIAIAMASAKTAVLWSGIAPVDQAGTTGMKARAADIPLYNAQLKVVCDSYPNVIYVDTHTPLLDTDRSDLGAVSGALNAIDSIHWNQIAAQLEGYALATLCLSRLTVTPYRTAGANLFPATWAGSTGGTATPGGGTIASTPPAGWNVQVLSGAAAVTISQSPLAADMIRLAITDAGAASSIYLQFIDTAALLALLVPGGTYQIGCKFQAGGIVNATRGPALQLNYNAGPQSWVCGQADFGNVNPQALPTKMHGGIRRSRPVTLPGALTSAAFIISFNVGATTGALTIDIGLPELRRLT